MTFVSKLAMAAVLTLGTTALGATPAAAQKNKKGDEQSGPDIKVSPEFRKAAAAAETALPAKDWATADTNLTAAEALAKNDDEKYYAAFLRLKLELGRGSDDGQLKALNTLINNPKTPPENVKLYGGVFNYQLGSRAAKAKKHDEAIAYMLKAREYGSSETIDIPIVLANSYAATGKNAEAIVEVGRAIDASKAKTGKAPEAWYQFAIPKVNASGDRAAMVSWLSRFITDYPTLKNWQWAVQVFRQTTPASTGRMAKIEKIDMYRLLRATNALPNRGEYADYAFTAQQGGLPWEALSVIAEGEKAEKLPKGDPDVAKTFSAATSQAKNEGSLDAMAKQVKTGADASQTGDAFLASGNQTKAIELYDLAISKGGVDADEVNLHRGIAYQQLGQKDQARAAFALVKSGPLANLAILYTTSLDLPPLS